MKDVGLSLQIIWCFLIRFSMSLRCCEWGVWSCHVNKVLCMKGVWSCRITKALWTPPLRWRTRKISAVDCDVRDLKAPMMPQPLASLPLGKAWKSSHHMESPPPSTYDSRMKFFKLNPSLKGLHEEMVPTGPGESNSHIFLPKRYSQGYSPWTLSPFWWPTMKWNEN